MAKRLRHHDRGVGMNINQALASRAFAFYYMLQCLVAVTLTKSALQRNLFRLLAAVLAVITFFSVPAG